MRYPGGKSSIAKHISQTLIEDRIRGKIIEPFAGGASVSLYALMSHYVDKVVLNDLDLAIYAVWYSILNRADQLIALIEKHKATIEEFKRNKKILKSKNPDLLNLAFSAVCVNRQSYGGKIIRPSFTSPDRMNKKSIIEKIKKIEKFKNKIKLTKKDAIEICKEYSDSSDTLIYLDPPYFSRPGSKYNLYRHEYCISDHIRLRDEISKLKTRWILSYNDCEEIRELYTEFKIIKYKKRYSISKKEKHGAELMIHSDNVRLSDYFAKQNSRSKLPTQQLAMF